MVKAGCEIKFISTQGKTTTGLRESHYTHFSLRNYATSDVIDVGHVDQLLLLLQGIVGWHYLLSFRKGWSSVPYAKGDKKGSIEAPFLSI